MLKRTLPALVTTALWTAAFLPAQAQDTADKSKPAQAAQASQPKVDPEVVGSVNGKPITWTQLIDYLQKNSPDAFNQAVANAIGTKASESLFGSKGQDSITITKAEVLAQIRKDPGPGIVNEAMSLLRDEAVNQEAAKSGVTVTDAQVDARIASLLKDVRDRGLIPPGVSDDQFLEQRHISRAQLRGRLRGQLLAFAVMNKEITQKLGHPLTADDYLQARHILITVKEPGPDAKPDEAKKSDADALAKITKIQSDIKAGKIKFEDAAKQYSDDGSKEKGGDLGPFMRGMMVKEFENTAFALKPGELSKPVRSQFGYHLIQVEKLGKDIPQADREKTLDQYDQQHYPQWVQELMSQRAQVVNNLRSANPMGVGAAGPRPGGIRPPGGRPVPAPGSNTSNPPKPGNPKPNG